MVSGSCSFGVLSVIIESAMCILESLNTSRRCYFMHLMHRHTLKAYSTSIYERGVKYPAIYSNFREPVWLLTAPALTCLVLVDYATEIYDNYTYQKVSKPHFQSEQDHYHNGKSPATNEYRQALPVWICVQGQ